MVNKTHIEKNGRKTQKLIESRNPFKIFHQNIRGLKSKVDELTIALLSDHPHIMCLTEHHLKNYEINNLPIDHFKLGSKYCRQESKDGGVCIFVHNELEFSSISLDKYCKEKDIEVCAVRINIIQIQLFILTVYKSPSGNFSNFLKNLDNILNTWYNNKTIFVICGDANMNYLENGKKRQQLDALLQTYNIIGTVWFPTRKINGSSTAIDNIFITKTTNHTISPHINRLSDHDAQILEIENTIVKKLSNNIFIRRDINDQSIQTFNLLLSYENWEEVFMEDESNVSFNKFLNIYLRVFQGCFTKKKMQ